MTPIALGKFPVPKRVSMIREMNKGGNLERNLYILNSNPPPRKSLRRILGPPRLCGN
jgi:hypothetical protein